MSREPVRAESFDCSYSLSERVMRFFTWRAVPSWLLSLLVHSVMLILLAVLTVSYSMEQIQRVLTVSYDLDEALEYPPTPTTPVVVPLVPDVAVTDAHAFQNVPDLSESVADLTLAAVDDPLAPDIDHGDFLERTVPQGRIVACPPLGSRIGLGLEDRNDKGRRRALRRRETTVRCEGSVATALAWLAEHQLPDGGWSFDHRAGRCQGRCSHHGSETTSRNGATALALLPFLGAGQTHKQGRYKEHVRRGLFYLTNRMKADGSFHEPGGRMYSHGLVAIALCEAHAMTHDKQLMRPAQKSIDFIVSAQDPVGGGWRYAPKQAGDTSVVGWQLMALKSGHMAYLRVPPETVKGAARFLDSVQRDSGARYGYTAPGVGRGTTAVGLLCRMYLGWRHDHAALERGVRFLDEIGPSDGNIYYNYYATQVMHHYGGASWMKWNTVMREQLVDSQSKAGHTKGSWYINGDMGSQRGGRLYCTAMATMILEVYYRHMPIYNRQAAEEDFPL